MHHASFCTCCMYNALGQRKCIYADKSAKMPIKVSLGQRHVRIDILLSDKQSRKIMDKVEKAGQGRTKWTKPGQSEKRRDQIGTKREKDKAVQTITKRDKTGITKGTAHRCSGETFRKCTLGYTFSIFN
jgi:hypothetical protein